MFINVIMWIKRDDGPIKMLNIAIIKSLMFRCLPMKRYIIKYNRIVTI